MRGIEDHQSLIFAIVSRKKNEKNIIPSSTKKDFLVLKTFIFVNVKGTRTLKEMIFVIVFHVIVFVEIFQLLLKEFLKSDVKSFELLINYYYL